MDTPLGYFLTWTCYGTRLHGDPRGTVDRSTNQINTPVIAPNSFRVSYEQEVGGPPVSLSLQARRIVHRTIPAHCADRGWELHTHNVRTQHIHVVLSCGKTPPERALDQFKAWCTRGLREGGLFGKDDSVWAVHGSTVYLWTMNELVGAVEYVRDGQGPPLV